MKLGRQRRSATVAEVEQLRRDAIRWRRFEQLVLDSEKYRYGANRPYHEDPRQAFARVGRAVIDATAVIEIDSSGIQSGQLWREAAPRWLLAGVDGAWAVHRFRSEQNP